jgi:hypothetical protein
MIDEPDAPASQERLTHVQIAQDAEQARFRMTGCMSKLLPFMTCLMLIFFLSSMPKALITSPLKTDNPAYLF